MTKLTGTCPICDVGMKLEPDTEESEIISCPDCDTRLVVSKVGNPSVILEQAPEIEEDWGQ